jgi:hypothetical protein
MRKPWLNLKLRELEWWKIGHFSIIPSIQYSTSLAVSGLNLPGAIFAGGGARGA